MDLANRRAMIGGMGTRASWMRVVGALASGGMVALTVPPYGMSALIWVALVPLLIALWTQRGKRAAWKGFGLAWLAGIVCFAIQLSWLAVVSPLGAVVLPIYLGGFWGLFGALAATCANPWSPLPPPPANEDPRAARRARMLDVSGGRPASNGAKSLRLAACLGAIWAFLEWLRSWLFTGFGWNGLGIAFHDTLVIAQAADLIGTTGLSLLVVFFQAVLVQAGRRILQGAADGKPRPRWDFGVAAIIVAMVVCYGSVRMAMIGSGESVRLKTLLVQINIPQDGARAVWDPWDVHIAYEEETLGALEALEAADDERLRAAMDANHEGGITLSWPDWVLWPESALTGRLLRSDDGSWAIYRDDMETLSRVRSAGPFTLLYGINELEADPMEGGLIPKTNGRAFNSLAAISPDDELQTFRKHHLVIFGETIPFVESIPLLRKIYEQQAGVPYVSSFTPGDSFEPLNVEVAGTRVGIIPSVCFEDTVPRLKRRFVRNGPQVIVNVTNDGWFNESGAAAQHFANGRFRAIELRRPMLRCANTGVTAALDSVGSLAHPDTGAPQKLVDESGSHFTRGTLLAELDVPLHPPTTLYALIGDWGVIGIGVAGLGIAFTERRRQRSLNAIVVA
jgi:apolipoprotein N-acyltransferase